MSTNLQARLPLVCRMLILPQLQTHTHKAVIMADPRDSESHQGPPPERQTGAQMHDPPASGKGTDDSSNKEQINKTALDVRLSGLHITDMATLC